MNPKLLHQECFICGSQNPLGLGLNFKLNPAGEAVSDFGFPLHTCGYPERIHGGIISAILDSAMANSLLLSGIVAYTAKLEVTFLHPVLPEIQCQVSGYKVGSKFCTYKMQSSLFQKNIKVATATAVFFKSDQTGESQ